MAHLSNDEFFVRLSDLFTSRKSKSRGAIYLTQTRQTHNQDSSQPSGETQASSSPTEGRTPLIVRATIASKPKQKAPEKVKLSTVVTPETLEDFYVRYAEVCKTGMGALKPRDRSKKKAKARKKKGGPATGIV